MPATLSHPHTEFRTDELDAFYHAEQQLVKALQLMGRAASHVANPAETLAHVARLQRAVSALLHSVVGSDSSPVELQAHPEITDRVEQYENAALGSVHVFAKSLGQEKVAELLEQTAVK